MPRRSGRRARIRSIESGHRDFGNTHRTYAWAIDRTIEAVDGRSRRLVGVADTEIGDALNRLWGGSTPAIWNRNRAAVAAYH